MNFSTTDTKYFSFDCVLLLNELILNVNFSSLESLNKLNALHDGLKI